MDTAPTWDPRDDAVLDDQIAAYDALRRECPIAHSDYLQWSLLRHADVLRVLDDPATFGNETSSHLSVPNGMDPPRHTAFRALVDPYFTADRMSAFRPACRAIARGLVEGLPEGRDVEVMQALAQPFAAQVQCAFMGWPAALHAPLQQWIRRNHDATLAGDREAMASVALQFDETIRRVLDDRRHAPRRDGEPDVTDRLLAERIDGRPLDDAEIVSLVRNWTVGELATIAACVGIVVHHLARDPALQQRLREEPALRLAAIDEMLRIEPPLIANRRRVRSPVTLAGQPLDTGERLSVLWASANRDEAVFGDPDDFRLDRDPAANLLYGRGIHVCPGAPLARMELEEVVAALLDRWPVIVPGSAPPQRARYPAGGWARVDARFG